MKKIFLALGLVMATQSCLGTLSPNALKKVLTVPLINMIYSELQRQTPTVLGNASEIDIKKMALLIVENSQPVSDWMAKNLDTYSKIVLNFYTEEEFMLVTKAYEIANRAGYFEPNELLADSDCPDIFTDEILKNLRQLEELRSKRLISEERALQESIYIYDITSLLRPEVEKIVSDLITMVDNKPLSQLILKTISIDNDTRQESIDLANEFATETDSSETLEKENIPLFLL